MKITEIRIFRLKTPQGQTRAFAEVTFDGELAIRDFKVIETHRGLFVSMPARRSPDGQYHDLVIPVTGELREQIQASVLRAYEDEIARPDPGKTLNNI